MEETMDINANRKILILIPFLIMVCLLSSDSFAQETMVSRTWVDFYGSLSWSDQNPVESGALIQVFDPDSTLCGEFTVNTEGIYGFMPVYRDDPLTPDIDEGAQKGDFLYFEINGFPAQILQGGSPVWSQQNLKLNINLISTVTKIENQTYIPRSFGLSQNFPNPFNSETSIQIQLPEKCFVSLTIYNVLGQKVRILINEIKEPGRYTSIWDGQDDHGLVVSSGIYLYRLEAGDFVQTKKLLFFK